MNKFKKVNDTSIRVLETLKILSNGSSSIQNIIRYFENSYPDGRVYTNEVILKYINTLKVFGCKIVKEKDKYSLMNTVSRIKLNTSDLKSICLLENFAADFPEEIVKTELGKFLQELEKRFDDNTRMLANSLNRPQLAGSKFSYEKYSGKIKKYEKYCTDAHRLKITYMDDSKNEKSIIAEPHNIKYGENNVYFCVYNPTSAQIQDLSFDNILEVEQLPSKSNPQNMFSSVTFELKDRLAKGYTLHDGEKLASVKPDGSIVIISHREDRGLLLRRLMRYGVYCEVIAPQSLRAEMAQLIAATIENYTN